MATCLRAWHLYPLAAGRVTSWTRRQGHRRQNGLKMDGKTLVAPATAAGPSTASGGASSGDDPIVQYVVLRRDLWSELGWPLGSVAAQACHAATAALWLHQDDPDVAAYCADLDHMRKVVLEVKGVEQLKNLSQKLTDAGILHKLWVEQPEDVPTSLATKPYRKSVVGEHVRKLQLCKAPVGVK